MSSIFHFSKEFFAGIILGTVTLLNVFDAYPREGDFEPLAGERLPTGMQVTPPVANDAMIESLNPDLSTHPD